MYSSTSPIQSYTEKHSVWSSTLSFPLQSIAQSRFTCFSSSYFRAQPCLLREGTWFGPAPLPHLWPMIFERTWLESFSAATGWITGERIRSTFNCMLIACQLERNMSYVSKGLRRCGGRSLVDAWQPKAPPQYSTWHYEWPIHALSMSAVVPTKCDRMSRDFSSSCGRNGREIGSYMDVPQRFLGPFASPYMASMKCDEQTLRPKASKEAKKFGFLKARSLLVPSSALSLHARNWFRSMRWMPFRLNLGTSFHHNGSPSIDRRI